MSIVKQLLENMLIEDLEFSIQKLIDQQKVQSEKLSSKNKVTLERLKDLQHMLITARKIVNQVVIDITDQDQISD